MTAGIQIEFDEVAANFTIVPNQIIYNRELTSDARFLWLYLRSHKVGYPLGYRQMEADTGWSEVTVRKHLKALEGFGFVRLNQTRVGSRNGKLLISLLLCQTKESEGSTFEGSESKGLNKTIKTNKTTEETSLPQAPLEVEPSEEAFEEFWAVYPRKVEKLDARKAFIKAWATYGVAILAGVYRLAGDPNLPPKQFIPYPASWLNAGGWDSEPFPPRERTAEEKAEAEQVIRERRRAMDAEASRRLLEESARARREAEANPPERCEHDRIKVVCPKCSPIHKMS